jgi:hypothetical protein
MKSPEISYKPVTILVKYDNEYGDQEERHSGFLTGDSHAIYFESAYSRVIFTQATPTDELDVYLDNPSNYISLGILDDEAQDAEQVIFNLANLFHTITGYELLTRITTQVNIEIDLFNDLPKLLQPYAKE